MCEFLLDLSFKKYIIIVFQTTGGGKCLESYGIELN